MCIQHLPRGEVLVAGMRYKCDTLPLSLLYTLDYGSQPSNSSYRTLAGSVAKFMVMQANNWVGVALHSLRSTTKILSMKIYFCLSRI